LEDGRILGDPDSVEFTRYCQSLGWKSPTTAFDVLPVVIHLDGDSPKWFDIPEEKILRIPISHPGLPWLAALNYQWYAVPVISDMLLEIGGIAFPCAPFNGWYMLTEIAARNLADTHRYNVLPRLADKMGLSPRQNRSLWKDKCLVVLQEAVLHSFEAKGVSLVDHHTAAEQFMEFCKREEKKGRSVQADWSWIVPPMAGSTMEVFHTQWENEVYSPNFYYQSNSWLGMPQATKNQNKGCPFHFNQSDSEEFSLEELESQRFTNLESG
jgi:nitric-oxide synthase